MVIAIAIAADSYLDSQTFQTRILVPLGSLFLFGLLWFATRRINRLLGSRNQPIADLELTREREARGSAALAATLRSIGDAAIAAHPVQFGDAAAVLVMANVTSTQHMLSRLLGENIRIHTTLATGLWDVFADPGQIDQIVLNLAVNARDAMERGGVLTIETANLERGAPLALDLADGEYVRLSVSDTGQGMDEETQRHIFEPFFTTKEVGRGTGLGLATVYGIVRQSGGHIRVSSEPDKGSSFSIYLPRAAGLTLPAVKGASGSTPAQRIGETVLVVEDDETVRHLVVSMLKSSGYRAIAPATPHEALRICGEFSTPLDLLPTDVVLPETDGAEVAEKAVASRPNLRVLFMSGYTEHPVPRLPGFDRGAPFIQKPFTKAALTAKVREVLQAK